MLCPKCGREMKEGTATFMGTAGLIPMICSFTANEEKSKKLFERGSVSITVMQGFESESFFCEDCKLIMPIIR